MPFHDLYSFCQEQSTPVSRKQIGDKVLELTGTERIAVRKTALDTSVCRGFFLSARNKEHPIVKQHGTHVIVLARDLNYCWERFVFVKELMHLFDTSAYQTDSAEAFERLLSELHVGGSDLAPQTISEIKCTWMALACLCPESTRILYADDRQSGKIDDYAIALSLRIPQVFVPRLFEDRFKTVLGRIIKSEKQL